MKSLVKNFLKNESGATSIEYAMIAMGIAGAIIVIVQTLGQTVNGKYVSVVERLTAKN